MTATTKNYHREIETFTVGDSIKFISDIGEILDGKILSISDYDDSAVIEFGDGEFGCELLCSCWKN